jgi:hypothetical protein
MFVGTAILSCTGKALSVRPLHSDLSRSLCTVTRNFPEASERCKIRRESEDILEAREQSGTQDEQV